MKANSAILAAACALTALGASAGTASAHQKNRSLFFNSGHHEHVHLFIGSGGGCGYYYERWLDTGRFYWKSKYYECKGWW